MIRDQGALTVRALLATGFGWVGMGVSAATGALAVAAGWGLAGNLDDAAEAIDVGDEDDAG